MDNRFNLFTDTTTPYNDEMLLIADTGGRVIPLDKFESLKIEIKNFEELGENWDGYGAVPVIPEIARVAETLLNILGSFIDGITDVFPNPHGTITIEWENRNDEKLSLEIGKDNYSYFIRFNNETPELVNGSDILGDCKKITEALANLFGQEIQKFLY